MSPAEKDARTATILIRVNERLKEELEKAADKAGRTLSDYCKMRVEGGKYFALSCPTCGVIAITDSYAYSGVLQRGHELRYGQERHHTHVYEAPMVYGAPAPEGLIRWAEMKGWDAVEFMRLPRDYFPPYTEGRPDMSKKVKTPEGEKFPPLPWEDTPSIFGRNYRVSWDPGVKFVLWTEIEMVKCARCGSSTTSKWWGESGTPIIAVCDECYQLTPKGQALQLALEVIYGPARWDRGTPMKTIRLQCGHGLSFPKSCSDCLQLAGATRITDVKTEKEFSPRFTSVRGGDA